MFCRTKDLVNWRDVFNRKAQKVGNSCGEKNASLSEEESYKVITTKMKRVITTLSVTLESGMGLGGTRYLRSEGEKGPKGREPRGGKRYVVGNPAMGKR